MKLVIAPSIHVARSYEIHRPSHVLGLLSPGQCEIVLSCAPPQRLELRFNDIDSPRPPLVAPDEAGLRAILTFARTWDGAAPFLIYCFAGISRSTAAAFAIACQSLPQTPEAAIAKTLRTASPWATPNPLMVALADALLQRQGRMTAAAAGIGRGEDFAEANSFELALT